VILLNKTGLPGTEFQDTIALKKDTIQLAVPEKASSNANTDSLSIKKDTSHIQVQERQSISNGLIQESLVSQKETIPGSEITNQNYVDSIPYYIPDNLDLYNLNNSLTNFNTHYFSIKEPSELIYKGETKSPGATTLQEITRIQDRNEGIQKNFNPDWLIAIIIGSLVILAWLKLFFNKFFDQVIISMWNFQLGSKFLRDQGIFSRRVGLILNINFLLVFGLFMYLVFTHFNINPLSLKPFPAYLLYTGVLTILLLIRYILTSLTGKIFKQEEYFREYLYHILIIYKNLGIVFVPIVFCIAYIQENLRIYFIIIAFVLIAFAYLFRFIKGYQLIIKKDVFIFYLILYLCTLEIMPVLFYYKFFSGWI
jgi:Domain of unknown function (DUF4271)